MTKLNIVDGYIDKVTIVGDMKRDGIEPLALKFLGNSLDPRVIGPYLINKGQYDRAVQVKTKDSTALIQVSSRKITVSDFRIEFNPSKCDEEDMKFIHYLLSLVKYKRCTRIDLCINFHDDVMGFKLVDKRRRGQVEYKSPSGRLETLYRGSEQSEDFIKFYDKKKQQKDVKYRDIEHDWCRLEETIKDKKAEDFEKWEWFKGIKLINSNPIFSEDIDPKDRMVARCIMAGLEDIKGLKPTYAKKIKKIIESVTYEDEFNVQEEIKKTSIVWETNEVLKKLLN
ncbi:replication initiation factor domain-containing protein [Priestia megaterium]|uniref:replication initiation factor domain-containing protein n=1 Tax=Priestia megaterium TaxID=1404 RepID=UPI003391DBC8